MAESSYMCDVYQGFNFKKDTQTIIGHINKMKISDQELSSDLKVTDPENVGEYVKVFGLASNIYWGGGYADPVMLSCQVTVDNKNVLSTMVHKTLSNTDVEFEFTIYDYDPKEKKYYKCFHCNATPLDGLVQKSGGELNMAIASDQSTEVMSPKNHTFTLGVMPSSVKQQEIHLAVSTTDKFVKQFGVEVSK